MEKYRNRQPKVVQMLQNSYKKDRLSHSYLFVGKRGSNKLNLAKEFIKMILCKKSDACDECNVCRRVDSLTHTNIIYIEPINNSIKKEQILHLQREFAHTSLEEGPKFYIINDAEKMNNIAANSLLKFYEEPNSEIYGILITTNKDKILKTIYSRSQVINFSGLDNVNLVEQLKEEGIDETLARIYKSITIDKIEILKLIDDENTTKIIDMVQDMVNILGKKSVTLFYNLEQELSKDQIRLFLNLFIVYLRDVINYNIKKEIEIFINNEQEIFKISRLGNKNIIKCLEILFETINNLELNVNISLLMNSALLKIDEVLL